MWGGGQNCWDGGRSAYSERFDWGYGENDIREAMPSSAHIEAMSSSTHSQVMPLSAYYDQPR